MSGKLERKYRIPEICKIMTISVIAAISDPAIHDVWLPLGQFIEHLRAKYPNANGIQFATKEIVKHFNKVFQQKSLKANEVEISDDGKKVIVFRHDFQPKGKSMCRFLYVTGISASTLPRLPTYRNSLEWEENCVALRTRQLRTGSRRQLFHDVTISAAPKMMSRKRRRTITEEGDNENEGFELSASILQLDCALLSLSQSRPSKAAKTYTLANTFNFFHVYVYFL
jgi:hypothetical protein